MKNNTLEKMLKDYTLQIGNNLDSPTFLDEKHSTIYISKDTFKPYTGARDKSVYGKMVPGVVDACYRKMFNVKYNEGNEDFDKFTAAVYTNPFHFDNTLNTLRGKLKNANGNRIADYK
jgi:hypothetical protein